MNNFKKIYIYIEDYGIKHSNLGFKYLATSIHLGLESPSLCQKITDLYEKAGNIHCTKGINIERAIRYSIQNTNMTNKEFIIKAINNL